MFSLTGQPNHAWDGKLPGCTAFEVIQDAVAACHPAQTKTATAKTTSLLWAALQGLVVLRNDRPAFPWAHSTGSPKNCLGPSFPQTPKRPTSRRQRTAHKR
jgi:hypothetical protein